MKAKPQNFNKILIFIICIIVGIIAGGAIAKFKNIGVYNAIDILNDAADYYDSAAYSAAAGIGDVEARNNVQSGYVIGGICGLFLGLLISLALAPEKKKEFDVHKDDTMNTNVKQSDDNANNIRLVAFTENQAVNISSSSTKNIKDVPLYAKSANTSPSLAPSSVPTIASLLRRGELFLEDGDFDLADQYFNRALDMNPECAKAYIGRLLVELKLKSEDQLAGCGVNIIEYNNYKKAVRFADNTYMSILYEYNQYLYNNSASNDK